MHVAPGGHDRFVWMKENKKLLSLIAEKQAGVVYNSQKTLRKRSHDEVECAGK